MVMVARTNPMAIMCLNFVVSQTVLIVFVLVVSLLIVYLPSRFKQELLVQFPSYGRVYSQKG